MSKFNYLEFKAVSRTLDLIPLSSSNKEKKRLLDSYLSVRIKDVRFLEEAINIAIQKNDPDTLLSLITFSHEETINHRSYAEYSLMGFLKKVSGMVLSLDSCNHIMLLRALIGMANGYPKYSAQNRKGIDREDLIKDMAVHAAVNCRLEVIDFLITDVFYIRRSTGQRKGCIYSIGFRDKVMPMVEIKQEASFSKEKNTNIADNILYNFKKIKNNKHIVVLNHILRFPFVKLDASRKMPNSILDLRLCGPMLVGSNEYFIFNLLLGIADIFIWALEHGKRNLTRWALELLSKKELSESKKVDKCFETYKGNDLLRCELEVAKTIESPPILIKFIANKLFILASKSSDFNQLKEIYEIFGRYHKELPLLALSYRGFSKFNRVLKHAVSNKNLKIASFIINAMGDKATAEIRLDNYAIFANIIVNNDFKMLEMLLDKLYDLDYTEKGLFFKLEIDYGIERKYDILEAYGGSYRIFQLAIVLGHSKILNKLLGLAKIHGLLESVIRYENFKMIFEAVRQNQPHILRDLTKVLKECDIKTSIIFENSPILRVAIQIGNLEILAHLIQLDSTNEQIRNIITIAVDVGNLATLKYFIGLSKKEKMAIDDTIMTASTEERSIVIGSRHSSFHSLKTTKILVPKKLELSVFNYIYSIIKNNKFREILNELYGSNYRYSDYFTLACCHNPALLNKASTEDFQFIKSKVSTLQAINDMFDLDGDYALALIYKDYYINITRYTGKLPKKRYGFVISNIRIIEGIVFLCEKGKCDAKKATDVCRYVIGKIKKEPESMKEAANALMVYWKQRKSWLDSTREELLENYLNKKEKHVVNQSSVFGKNTLGDKGDEQNISGLKCELKC